jgi:hypothetical protein
MPSSPFATHISTEHLCYENAVRRSSLASDYDVDKRLITRCTSTAKSVVIAHRDPRGSLAHTHAVVERGTAAMWHRPRDESCEVSTFALFKDS